MSAAAASDASTDARPAAPAGSSAAAARRSSRASKPKYRRGRPPRRKRGVPFQRLAVREMEPHPLARQQVVVDRLTHEGVAKAVPPGSRLDLEDVLLDGLPERGVELDRLEGGDRGQELMADALTGRG